MASRANSRQRGLVQAYRDLGYDGPHRPGNLPRGWVVMRRLASSGRRHIEQVIDDEGRGRATRSV